MVAVAYPQDRLQMVRHFARILRLHSYLLRPDEIAQAVSCIEEQATLALQDLQPVQQPLRPEVKKPSLSAREIEVLTLISAGLPDKQIAVRLGISTFTVNKHVSAILEKMQASSRTEAGVRAVLEGVIHPGEGMPQPG